MSQTRSWKLNVPTALALWHIFAPSMERTIQTHHTLMYCVLCTFFSSERVFDGIRQNITKQLNQSIQSLDESRQAEKKNWIQTNNGRQINNNQANIIVNIHMCSQNNRKWKNLDNLCGNIFCSKENWIQAVAVSERYYYYLCFLTLSTKLNWLFYLLPACAHFRFLLNLSEMFSAFLMFKTYPTHSSAQWFKWFFKLTCKRLNTLLRITRVWAHTSCKIIFKWRLRSKCEVQHSCVAALDARACFHGYGVSHGAHYLSCAVQVYIQIFNGLFGFLLCVSHWCATKLNE